MSRPRIRVATLEECAYYGGKLPRGLRPPIGGAAGTLAIDASTPAPTIPTAATGLSSMVSNSFTPPVGAVLVILFGNSINGNNITALTDSLGTHLNYTVQATTFNGNAASSIWTSSPIQTSTSMTVTTTGPSGVPAGNDLILGTFVFTGAAALQIGKHTVATSNSGTPSITFPAGTSSNSWLLAVVPNATNNTGPTVPGGQTTTFNGNSYIQTNGTVSSWIQGNSAAGNSNLTINDTAPTLIKWAISAYEVIAAPDPTPLIPPRMPLGA